MLNVLDALGVCTNVLKSGGIPSKLAYIIHIVISLIQVGVPILLIIWGMMDLGKAVMAQKEDEIKKGQQTFIKRLIAAAIVFFVVVIVELLVNLVADTDKKDGILKCMKSIINCNSTTCTD